MNIDTIQVNYDVLETIADTFESEINDNAAQFARTMQQVETLRSGNWVGESSDAFFDEMDNQVAPAVVRLLNALASARDAVRQIHALMQGAEEEAAAPFRGEAARMPPSGVTQAAGGRVENALFTGNAPELRYAQYGRDDREPLTLSAEENKTFEGRKKKYAEIVERQTELTGSAKNVKFFEAAHDTVRAFEFSDDNDLLGLPEFLEPDPLGKKTEDFSQRLSQHLMEKNLVQAQTVLSDPTRLPLPGNSTQFAQSALEWDLAMVRYEQDVAGKFVQAELTAGRIGESNLQEVSNAMNKPGWQRWPAAIISFGIYRGSSNLGWAQGVHKTLDYQNAEHRIAIGAAAVFQKHGLSEAKYKQYMQDSAEFMATHHAIDL